MLGFEQVTGGTVAMENYIYLMEICEKYRKLIEDNIDTSSLDKDIYPDLPSAIVYKCEGK